MNVRVVILRGLFAASLLLATSARADEPKATRPNIVWLIPDDMSSNFSCYGEKAIGTPNVDRRAPGGVPFHTAY